MTRPRADEFGAQNVITQGCMDEFGAPDVIAQTCMGEIWCAKYRFVA